MLTFWCGNEGKVCEVCINPREILTCSDGDSETVLFFAVYCFLSVIELSSFISHYFFIESSSPWVVIDCLSSSFSIPLVSGCLLETIPACYLTAWCTETPYFPGICWGHSSGLPSVQLGLAVLGFPPCWEGCHCSPNFLSVAGFTQPLLMLLDPYSGHLPLLSSPFRLQM